MTQTILKGEDFWPGLGGWGKHIERKVPPQMRAIAKGPRTKVTIEAYINHSRWIADCPYCSGAEMVDPHDKKFYCFNCLMIDVGGRPIRVKFPPKPTREKIEAVLLKRPFEENRNWFIHESLQNLKDENIEYGLEV